MAQSTAYQTIIQNLGNGADENTAGELHLFAPSSTTYVKHFYCTTNGYEYTNVTWNSYIAGYFNTTAAITAIDFKMSSGNFDGIIALYGISKS